jgi:hypothetical protein
MFHPAALAVHEKQGGLMGKISRQQSAKRKKRKRKVKRIGRGKRR